MQRSNPSRVRQKDRLRQPGFFFLGLPFLRWRIQSSGSSTTLQLGLRWTTRGVRWVAPCAVALFVSERSEEPLRTSVLGRWRSLVTIDELLTGSIPPCQCARHEASDRPPQWDTGKSFRL